MADPSRRGGSGLGLAIAAEHAALLGGRLDAANRSGGGLEIELVLPVTQPLPDGDAAAISGATLRIDEPHHTEVPPMNRNRPIPIVAVLLAASALVAACGGASGPLGTIPVASASPEPSVAQGSPDATPSEEPSTSTPSDEPSDSLDPGASVSPTPTATSSGTTILRAYFWLGGLPGSEGPVAVLRTIPGTKAVATAAVTALLAGPTAGETGRAITTQIPSGTQLLDLAIDKSVATINLSAEFVGGGDSAAVQTRQAQVTYTLTQFPTVKSVIFQIEGVQLGDAVRARPTPRSCPTSGSTGRRSTPRSATRRT